MSIRNDIIEALIAAVKLYVKSADCPALINKVAPFHENFRMEFRANTPVFMVMDQGNEQRLIEDATHERFAFDVQMGGYVQGSTDHGIQEELNNILLAIKRFVNSDPNLGINVLDFQYIEALSHAIDKDGKQGETAATGRIIYWWEKPIPSTVGSNVYGTAFLDTAKDKLVALINTLMATMDTGYDPTFSYVYENHNVAQLRLNAVSVAIDGEVDTVEDAEAASSSMTSEFYEIPFSIRVHTGYEGGITEDDKTIRLLSSITNKLKANYNLGGQYRLKHIEGIKPGMTFDESATVGGEIKAIVTVPINHSQE